MKRLLAIAITAIALLSFAPTRAARAYYDPNENDTFTIVWLTDTQNIAYDNLVDVFESMGNWIVDHKQSENIQYIVHTGDLVDNGFKPAQWKCYDTLCDKFIGKVPYIAIAGNHDLGVKRQEWEGYLTQPYVKSIPKTNTFANGKSSFATFETKGEKFIIVGIGYGAEIESTEWVNEVLLKHADYTAIIITHDYMKSKGVFSASGEWLFENVVRKNENVKLVLCGHYRGNGFRTDTIDGRTVTTMMYNYQNYNPNCGQIRTLEFNTKTRTIEVHTFSPWTGKEFKDSTFKTATFTIENAF